MNKTNFTNHLIIKLQLGDIEAFDEIYRHYFQKLYNFVLKFMKDTEETKEIVQEVFVKLWQNHNKIDIYASFDSYLFTIAYNTSISALKKKASQIKYAEYIKHKNDIFDASDGISELQYKELVEQLEISINKLSPRQKEIFNLSRIDGLLHNEIAEKLNISKNTVKNQIVTTLKYLKSQFGSEYIMVILYLTLHLYQYNS